MKTSMKSGRPGSTSTQPVDTLSPYKVPRLPTPVDLYLDGNEGAVPDLTGDFGKLLLALETIRRYPDPSNFEQFLAERFEIDANRVFVTAGGDEALDRICRVALGPERTVILPSPTFSMLRHYAILARGEVVAVRWDGGPYPVDEVMKAINERTSLVVVVSPNNPTGAVANANDIRLLAEAAAPALVLVDLAYVEFADQDLTHTALEYDNCVVVRSFSKAWGLAGLRVGCALGAPRVIARLRTAGGPYSVSSLSLIVAKRVIESSPSPQTYVQTVRIIRHRVSDNLTRLGAHPYASQGNFILCRFKNADFVRQGLAGLGIAVRGYPGDPELSDTLRISCPSEAQVDRLVLALQTVLAPQAILFLLDSDQLAAFEDTLERLSHRLRLALVDTGPRRDTEYRTVQAGRYDLFETIVCSEDLPLAPPSELIRLGLERMGVTRVWGVGASPDDIRASRAVGVLPLGILGVEDSPASTPDGLLAAGAGRVLTSIDELEELLP